MKRERLRARAIESVRQIDLESQKRDREGESEERQKGREGESECRLRCQKTQGEEKQSQKRE